MQKSQVAPVPVPEPAPDSQGKGRSIADRLTIGPDGKAVQARPDQIPPYRPTPVPDRDYIHANEYVKGKNGQLHTRISDAKMRELRRLPKSLYWKKLSKIHQADNRDWREAFGEDPPAKKRKTHLGPSSTKALPARCPWSPAQPSPAQQHEHASLRQPDPIADPEDPSKSSIERQDFGGHWEAVKSSRDDASLTDNGLEKLCKFLIVAKELGVPANDIPLRYKKKPIHWQNTEITRKGRKVCEKVRKLMRNRQVVDEHHPPAQAQNPANQPDEPSGGPGDEQIHRSATLADDPWDPPMVAIGEDSLGNCNAITYHHWLGPEDMRLRELPSTKQNQSLLKFANGYFMFPTDLLEASAEDRYNWHQTVVCFDKEASEAQVPASIPASIPAALREACKNKVRSCNPRLKPSNQECYESITQCLKQKLPLHLADLIALFCFVHYCVGETGRNRWLWEKMKLAGLEGFCNPEYGWNIVDGVPRHRRKGRSQISSKKDRAKFQRRTLHVFKGYNDFGVAIYKTYYDKYLANEAALAQLHQDQLDISTDIDVEERAAEGRATRDEHHSVPGHWLDEDLEERQDDL